MTNHKDQSSPYSISTDMQLEKLLHEFNHNTLSLVVNLQTMGMGRWYIWDWINGDGDIVSIYY